MFLMIWGVILTLLAGGAVTAVARAGVFDGYTGPKRVTPWEFLIGALVCAIIVVPLTVFVGNKIALSNNLEYHEFWSGYETAAVRADTECHRDGACHYTYRCDPYTVIKTRTVPDADGKGSHTETYTETEYHSCPESTVEWDFSIRTTLGNYHIERTFPDNAQAWRGDRIRGDVRRGTPPFWQDAANRIQAGDPRPVTVKKNYDNYILASQSSILHQYSDAVDKYKSVLPAPASTRDLYNLYYADKAYFVGMDAQPGWNEAVMRFNAAFGSDLQGDLHVVVVGDGVTSDPDEFTGALNAHWTGKTFDRNALSKNALVVVVGAKGGKVVWTRAFTGMPNGNEALLVELRNVKGIELNPEVVVGHPVGHIVNEKFESATHGSGAIEKAVWGVNQFERVCMTCEQEGGNGFNYLGSEIQPTTGQKVWMLVAATFLSLIIWGLFVALGTHNKEGSMNGSYRKRFPRGRGFIS